MKKLIANNLVETIIKLLISIYSYIVLCKNFGTFGTTAQYSCLSLLIFIFIVYLFFTTKYNSNKKNNKYIITISIVISLILVYGKMIYTDVYLTVETGLTNIFNLKKIIIGLLYIIGLVPFFYSVLNNFFNKYQNINILKKGNNNHGKVVFILSWILIFISYIPYFLRCYPAMMSPDSFYQINTVEQGILTDLHPFVQTWFFGGIYSLGKMFFGPGNTALAFYIIIQMLILSMLFSLVVYLLYKNNVKRIIWLVVLAFYCLCPLHAYYSVTLWKDILFGGNFILIFISLYNLVKQEKSINFKNKYLYLFILSILILMFFRNNGIYVFFVMIPFLIYYFRYARKIMTLLSLSLVIFYYIIKGPIFNFMGVSSTRTVESYSIPLQQVARVISLDGEISPSANESLEKLLVMENIKANYTPHISDPIKNSIQKEYFNANQQEFIRTWLKLLVDNPSIYIESYLSSTLGYWYPDVIYHATSNVDSATETYNAYKYDIYNNPKGIRFINKIIDRTLGRTYPFANLIWSVGLACLLMFFSLVLTIYNSSRSKYIVCYSPFIGLWITMMIATPVFCELRYVYGIFTCLPILLLLPFMGKSEING